MKESDPETLAIVERVLRAIEARAGKGFRLRGRFWTRRVGDRSIALWSGDAFISIAAFSVGSLLPLRVTTVPRDEYAQLDIEAEARRWSRFLRHAKADLRNGRQPKRRPRKRAAIPLQLAMVETDGDWTVAAWVPLLAQAYKTKDVPYAGAITVSSFMIRR